jgi:hypothetical protein
LEEADFRNGSGCRPCSGQAGFWYVMGDFRSTIGTKALLCLSPSGKHRICGRAPIRPIVLDLEPRHPKMCHSGTEKQE